MSENRLIEAGDKVTLHYKGTFQDGEEFDSSYERNAPVTTVVGSGQLIPGLEDALVGLDVGGTKTVTVTPEQGYGDRYEERVAEVPRENFPEDVVAGLEPGAIVPLSNSDQPGRAFPATVLEVSEEFIRLDLNHPLAGQDLTFEVEVLSVEEKSE